jgi:hypothetical protein
MDAATQQPVIETVAAREGLRLLLGAWRAFLQGNVSGKNLFNDPRYIELYLAAHPDVEPLIFVLRKEGCIRAIAPFFLVRGRFLVQSSVMKLAAPSVRWVKVFGDDLVMAADEDFHQCAAALFTELAKHQQRYDIFAFDRLEVGRPLWDFVQSYCRRGPFRCYLASPQMESAHQIHFPPSHKDYMASLGSRTRQNLRRMTRKLVDDRQARLERITTAEELPRFLDEVDHVYRDTWQAKVYGYRPRNSPAELNLLGGLAREGWLRSYLLTDCSGPVAFDIAFQYDGMFYAQEIGYAQAAAEHSPGTVLMHLYIEDLYRERLPAKLDFGLGDAVYKRSLCNAQIPGAAVHLVAGMRWRAIVRFQRLLFALERGARWLTMKLKIDRFLRKLIKRQH